MKDFQQSFQGAAFVDGYVHQGPPAFMPGHSGMLQMAGLLLRERIPAEGRVLIVGSGGGLDTRALARAGPGWSFVGVDPARRMLDLAIEVVEPDTRDRLELIEGTVHDVPLDLFDAATCILVLGLLPDDGSKGDTLAAIRQRLVPGAPFILVDQNLDRSAADFERRLDRYSAFALDSGVDYVTVVAAREALRGSPGLVPAARNEALLAAAGFTQAEIFYTGMAWRGWVAYA
jgi:tRNA (cmo5U34)-methyltransferase